MSDGIQLTTSQEFEQERLSRAIEATLDADELRFMAKQLLQAWQSQRAATAWAIRQQTKGF
ncbi:hypothetical protein [Synechococcus sp. MIT S1220]|uniref:hypothetical protein n=1 Tax=Synechococcus sp. MIT S1220 TaxID=3082549 RepID=UPI0039B10D70